MPRWPPSPRGEIRLLVATTVVEVGVDVPEASIMVIEHAERFGLAQLHQLRGRVGRGADASFCLLLHEDWVNETARRRLTLLRDTEDGFLIADEDFRLRGGGDALGTRQAGLPGYKLADPVEHEPLLHMANRDAAVLLSRDPKLETRARAGGPGAAAAVRADPGDANAGGGVRWRRPSNPVMARLVRAIYSRTRLRPPPPGQVAPPRYVTNPRFVRIDPPTAGCAVRSD